MFVYCARRIIQTIPVLIGVTLIAFILMNLIPGTAVTMMMDPRSADLPSEVEEHLLEHYGFNDPLPIQYLKFLGNALRADLGFSFRFNQSVTRVVMERVRPTAILAVSAGVLATIVGISLGIYAAINRGKLIDTISMILALAGASVPVFWFGVLLMLLFSVNLGWLPPSGWGTPRHMILPAVALGYGFAAIIARVTRSSMLEILRKDYIVTARSKGLSERLVVYKHALKNAMIPVITVVAAQVGRLLSGAVLTETVFSWPGLGRLLIDSIQMRDLPTVQGCLILVALVFVFVNLATDITYALLDPQVRFD